MKFSPKWKLLIKYVKLCLIVYIIGIVNGKTKSAFETRKSIIETKQGSPWNEILNLLKSYFRLLHNHAWTIHFYVKLHFLSNSNIIWKLRNIMSNAMKISIIVYKKELCTYHPGNVI